MAKNAVFPGCRWLLELALTICVAIALVILANPLADSSKVTGLNGRYLPSAGAIPTQFLGTAGHGIHSVSEVTQLARAGWVMTNAGLMLALWAGAGLISLWIGRLPLSAPLTLPLVLFVWAVAARVSRPEWLDYWQLAYSILGAFAFSGLFLHVRRSPNRSLQALRPAAPWVFPGFVALTGVGLVWLLDLSARGYPKLRYIGQNQYDALFMGYMIFSLFAAAGPGLANEMLRIISFFDAATSGVRRLFGAFAIASGLVALTVIAYRATAPHLTSELIRVPFYVVLAWTAYRWGDVSPHPIRAAAIIVGASTLFAVGMLGTRDLGPLLVFALTACVLVAVPATHTLAVRGFGLLGLFAGIICGALLLATVIWMLFNIAPMVSARAASRVAAINNPHEAATEYLSQLDWLRAATPAGGFGLGATPWCGYVGAIGGPCNGVPQQIQSDYAFAGLAAIWGMPVAVLITAGCALWLAGLVFARGPANERIADPGLFIAWVILVWACGTLIQLLVTVLGTLGQIPVTGVPYPFLAWGKVSLWVNCAFAGLAVNRTALHILRRLP